MNNNEFTVSTKIGVRPAIKVVTLNIEMQRFADDIQIEGMKPR